MPYKILTNLMKFGINSKTRVNLNVGYCNKTTEETGETKFLTLQFNSFYCKKLIEYISPNKA
jgi:hypothetical protein